MIFTKRKLYKLQPKEFVECTGYIPNPGMGWYHIFPFCLSKEPDYEELFWCLEKQETLVLILLDIGEFRSEMISTEALERLREILGFFVKNKKDLILRFTYDREGNCAEREPDFVSRIEEHMKAFGMVLKEFSDQILVVQGLCIGNWGEMHGSKFLAERRMKQLYRTWRRELGDQIPIAVRTPMQWRCLIHSGALETGGLLGVFNDGMFGSTDDLGTYGQPDPPGVEGDEAVWKLKWGRKKELAFLDPITARVPFGGEAVGEDETGSLFRAVEEMRQTHLDYLNREHDAKRLDLWKQSKWDSGDVWNGVNGLAYIGAHLGYRLVFRGAELTRGKQQELELELENTGFAPFRKKAVLEAMLRLKDGKKIKKETVPFLELEAGERKKMTVPLAGLLDAEKPSREQDLGLELRIRLLDGRIIRPANEPAADSMFFWLVTA